MKKDSNCSVLFAYKSKALACSVKLADVLYPFMLNAQEGITTAWKLREKSEIKHTKCFAKSIDHLKSSRKWKKKIVKL